jgi:hypothetical protein
MVDYHLTTFQKKKKKLYLIVLGKIKTCNFTENWHILYNENIIEKKVMNAFFNWHWIYKDSISIQTKRYL